MAIPVGAAAAGLVFFVEHVDGYFSVAAFEEVIRSWGHWGVFASIGLMVLHSFVPFPAELVALANGMLYGPLWGTVVTWLGAMLFLRWRSTPTGDAASVAARETGYAERAEVRKA